MEFIFTRSIFLELSNRALFSCLSTGFNGGQALEKIRAKLKVHNISFMGSCHILVLFFKLFKLLLTIITVVAISTKDLF